MAGGINKPYCLIPLSSKTEGVSATSFIQAFSLAQTVFNIQLASPSAKPVDYILQDESSRKWLNEFKTKSYMNPISFSAVDCSRYAALLIPHSPGAPYDLLHDIDFGEILMHFWQERKPICAIGLGVAALFSIKKDKTAWPFAQYSLTCSSLHELARLPYFATLPQMPQDCIREYGATYSCSEPDAVYVILDRHLVTAQNEQSTLAAVQNLILLVNQRNVKTSVK